MDRKYKKCYGGQPYQPSSPTQFRRPIVKILEPTFILVNDITFSALLFVHVYFFFRKSMILGIVL